jgi:hypothetical protein
MSMVWSLQVKPQVLVCWSERQQCQHRIALLGVALES